MVIPIIMQYLTNLITTAFYTITDFLPLYDQIIMYCTIELLNKAVIPKIYLKQAGSSNRRVINRSSTNFVIHSISQR